MTRYSKETNVVWFELTDVDIFQSALPMVPLEA